LPWFVCRRSKFPVVISSQVLPYEVLEMPRDSVSFVDIMSTLTEMREINKQRNVTRDNLNQFIEVKSRPEVFDTNPPNASLRQVDDAISKLNDAMNTYGEALKVCGRDVAACALGARRGVEREPLVHVLTGLLALGKTTRFRQRCGDGFLRSPRS
jgi:hypothetical protein